MNNISVKFLNELFLLCFNKKDIVEIVSNHLKYQYIPKEFAQYKKILKSIITTFNNQDKLPTFGIVSQQYENDIKVQETLDEIKKSQFADKELIIETLEGFIKRSQFVALNEKLANLYKEGKHEDAIALQAKESEGIVNFSLKKNTVYYTKLYADFDKRVKNRVEKELSGDNIKDKVPFGIEPLDDITYGGIDVTDTALWIMRSGVGKSTAMKWTGVQASRAQRNVLHIQLEGSQEECEDKYDQVWTAMLYNDIRRGNIDENKYKELKKVVDSIRSYGNDIYIHAFEQFNTASMVDIRNMMSDLEKNTHIDLVIIDYLKYLDPGDGIKYGASTQDVKMKKENTSDKIKNIAKEFGTRILVADQASDVSPEIWNDPSKVLTRHNISGAKNLPDSYSYVFTGNQTRDEQKSQQMRIHMEKLRNYRLPDKPIKIYTNYNRGRFYNGKKTREAFYNTVTNSWEF